METEAAYEQTLINIACSLPPERVAELLDFARFLQTLALDSENKWDQLLAKPEAQRAMIDMAREAREDFHAGRTTDIDYGRRMACAAMKSKASPRFWKLYDRLSLQE